MVLKSTNMLYAYSEDDKERHLIVIYIINKQREDKYFGTVFKLSLPQVLLEPCGSSGAECWSRPGWWWPSPGQICGKCAAPPSEWDPLYEYTGNIFETVILWQERKKLKQNKNWSVWTSSSKTRLGEALSLESKKTVPSRPNFGIRTMIAFFRTNRTNPSSLRIPLVLKNNCKGRERMLWSNSNTAFQVPSEDKCLLCYQCLQRTTVWNTWVWKATDALCAYWDILCL